MITALYTQPANTTRQKGPKIFFSLFQASKYGINQYFYYMHIKFLWSCKYFEREIYTWKFLYIYLRLGNSVSYVNRWLSNVIVLKRHVGLWCWHRPGICTRSMLIKKVKVFFQKKFFSKKKFSNFFFKFFFFFFF